MLAPLMLAAPLLASLVWTLLKSLVWGIPKLLINRWLWVVLVARLFRINLLPTTNIGAPTIVALVHGRNADSNQLVALYGALVGESGMSVTSITFSSGSNPVMRDAASLIQHLEATYTNFSSRRIVLVGVSKGGLTALAASTKLTNPKMTVITLASPVNGTTIAALSTCRMTRHELEYNGEFVSDLALRVQSMQAQKKLDVYHAFIANDYMIQPAPSAAVYSFTPKECIFECADPFLSHNIIQYDEKVVAWVAAIANNAAASPL
jgi:triacylglycerol esterase/lipase EstA (alpha/beta hydrolase family)